MQHKIKKEAAKGLLIDTLSYGLIGLTISMWMIEHINPAFGVWPYILLFIAMIAFVGLGKYLPNIKAHEELSAWLGEEYELALSKRLEAKSYRLLLRQNWFVEHLALMKQKKPGRYK